MRNVMARLFSLEQWGVGWARADILDFVERPGDVDFTWLFRPSRDEFLADPFGLERDGKLTILAEHLRWGEPGTIVTVDVANGSGISEVLNTGRHLSYPFVVEDDGKRWICPEQAEAGRVALYRLLDDSRVAATAEIELLNLALRDPTLLRRDGRWWMFGTVEPSATTQELMLFHAEDLAGPWQPHPMNPIASGFANCRPAGRIISRNGRLLRPAQDSSVTYGGALVLNEIVSLTPAEYREKELRRIFPSELPGAAADGLHHVDYTESYVLIDSKVFRWHPLAWWLKLREKRRQRALADAS